MDDLGYRPRNRWLRRRADGARYGELLRYVVLGVIPLAVLTTAAWSNVEAVRVGYQVERLRLEKEELEKLIQRQRLELNELTNPLAVERAARETLGLAPPEATVILEMAGPEGGRGE